MKRARGGIDLVADEAAALAKFRVYEDAQGYGSSPIEQALYAALVHVFNERSWFSRLRYFTQGEEEEIPRSSDYDDPWTEQPWIALQYGIEKFRVDFLLQVYVDHDPDRTRQLVIECDGHDFHERTKKQAASDRSRDRRLQELGFEVYRFTGSEIWRDPLRCAGQVWDWARKAVRP